MKKMITVLCLAAAPVLFAQEKASQASLKQNTTTEQEAKEKEKANQVEAQKKAEAEKKVAAEKKAKKEKSEIKATERKATNKDQKAKSLK